jgi:hypothetical protein
MIWRKGKRDDGAKERARRREICARCPSLSKKLIKTCSHCNCPIVFVTISGPCPLNKW